MQNMLSSFEGFKSSDDVDDKFKETMTEVKTESSSFQVTADSEGFCSVEETRNSSSFPLSTIENKTIDGKSNVESYSFLVNDSEISSNTFNLWVESMYSRNPNTRGYICNQCQKTCEKISHMKEHVTIHIEGFGMLCHHCQIMFRTISMFRKHMKLNHSISIPLWQKISS